ncbi:MAG: SDR family oxidoreductase, partial [Verrucomicrobiota bacterium]
AYCASKGALNTLTKSLARALAPNVRVNAVCPGPINSRWLREGMTEEAINDRVANFPIPRLSQPEDIADTVFHLATGTAMTTGQLLVVDGGRTM